MRDRGRPHDTADATKPETKKARHLRVGPFVLHRVCGKTGAAVAVPVLRATVDQSRFSSSGTTSNRSPTRP